MAWQHGHDPCAPLCDAPDYWGEEDPDAPAEEEGALVEEEGGRTAEVVVCSVVEGMGRVVVVVGMAWQRADMGCMAADKAGTAADKAGMTAAAVGCFMVWVVEVVVDEQEHRRVGERQHSPTM